MDEKSLMTCPRCGNSGPFHQAEIENNSSGFLMLMVGGFLPYLISQSRNDDMVICSRCHYVFRPTTRIGKGIALFVAILCVAVFIVLAVMIFTSR